ncbi:MAG: M24 family metallopeptidase [Bacillota bacterium]
MERLMFSKLPKSESVQRIQRMFDELNANNPDWDTALVINRINQYYFTGTIQDGLLVFKRNGDVRFFVRRSFERAIDESPLSNIHPMQSYRDLLAFFDGGFGNTFIETECVPIAVMERIQKYFSIGETLPLDRIITKIRSVKSAYELGFMEEAGEKHRRVLIDIVPTLLTEGMREADFMAGLYRAMVKLGHQGLIRFSSFQAEIPIGQMGFGESTLAPTNFDGPGGMRGMSPATPSVCGDRLLRKGDLVFVDMAFGLMGYHTDKTQVYSFKGRLCDQALRLHKECMEVQKAAAALLRTGNIPSEVYAEATASLSPELSKNFMGYNNRRAPFIGHGIGLFVDEYPVIANGFNEPLRENMVIALEPKTGVAGVGTVGVEETYIVTGEGGRCITGGGAEIMEI